MKIKTFPEISPERFAVPQASSSERPSIKPTLSLCDAAAVLLVASVILCLGGAASRISLLAGTACAVLGGGVLLLGKEARGRRRQARDLARQLDRIQEKVRQWSRAIMGRHRRRKAKYNNSRDEVKVECEHFRAEADQVHDVLVLQRGSQKERFLAKHLIQDNVRKIPGLNFSMVSMLESFGVESALDVDTLKLTGIPVLSPSLNMELLTWREQLEAKFRYKPDHGITFNQLKVSQEDAVNRFKVSQARRVLMAAKQVDTLAIGARYELASELKKYDDFAAQGVAVAEQLKEFQGNRRRLELWVNRSWLTIVGLALGGPLVGALAYWLIHFVR